MNCSCRAWQQEVPCREAVRLLSASTKQTLNSNKGARAASSSSMRWHAAGLRSALRRLQHRALSLLSSSSSYEGTRSIKDFQARGVQKFFQARGVECLLSMLCTCKDGGFSLVTASWVLVSGLRILYLASLEAAAALKARRKGERCICGWVAIGLLHLHVQASV